MPRARLPIPLTIGIFQRLYPFRVVDCAGRRPSEPEAPVRSHRVTIVCRRWPSATHPVVLLAPFSVLFDAGPRIARWSTAVVVRRRSPEGLPPHYHLPGVRPCRGAQVGFRG